MQSLSKKFITFCAVCWSRLQSRSSSSVACDTLDTVFSPSWSTKHSLTGLRKIPTSCMWNNRLFTVPYFSVGFSRLVSFDWTAAIFVCKSECNLERVSKLPGCARSYKQRWRQFNQSLQVSKISCKKKGTVNNPVKWLWWKRRSRDAKEV